MKFDKETMKKILLLVFLTILMLWAMINYKILLSIFGYVMAVLSPLLIGFCIAFVLNVILRLIEGKIFFKIDHGKGGKAWKAARRPIAVILSLCAVAAIISFVILLVVPELKNTMEMLKEAVPIYTQKVADWLTAFAAEHDITSESASRFIEGYVDIKTKVINFAKNIFSNSFGVLDSAISTTISFFSGVFNAIVGIIFAIYILLRKETLGRQATQILYAYTPRKFADEALYVARLSNKIFSNFVTGQFVEAIIIGILCFIGMLILRMPYAPMIAVLVGFSALIPVFGAFIGTAVGAFLILMINPMQALWFILFIIVLQQVEGNFIYPNVVGSSIGLPAMWVMLAVLIGASLNGVLGMLVGVPASSVLYALLARDTFRRLDNKGIKIENGQAVDKVKNIKGARTEKTSEAKAEEN